MPVCSNRARYCVLIAYQHILKECSARGVRADVCVSNSVSKRGYCVLRPSPAKAQATAEFDCDLDASGAGLGSVADRVAPCVDSSAAVLNTGFDDTSLLRLWNAAIHKYGVLEELQHIHQNADAERDDAASAQAIRDETVALAEAVYALQRLGSSEARKRLETYQAFLDGTTVPTIHLQRSTKILSSFNPHWCVLTFTDLFYRGATCLLG